MPSKDVEEEVTSFEIKPKDQTEAEITFKVTEDKEQPQEVEVKGL